MHKKLRLVVVAVVAFTAVLLVGTVLAGSGSVAAAPPGMQPDVSVDPAQFPAQVSVVGADGRTVTCGGKPLLLSREDLLAAPPIPGSGRASDARTFVPRCGEGGKARWVALPER
jgi:hypothetical protein